ncbi:MAG: BMP family ABC transporter substrate-binding protein [Atopobiaceae bacterium]
MDENYRKAMKQGERDCRKAQAQGRHPYLTALDSITGEESFAGEKPLGRYEIPLSQVVGTRTEGRQVAFSRTFLPILPQNSEFAMKWSNLYEIQVTEGFRDPIKVYEFLHRFYVLEGNKRTSVMKYLGAQTIEAEVTRLVPSEADDTYQEFLAFWNVCPLFEIDFTLPGSYAKLAGYFGQDLKKKWPDELVQYLRSTYYFFAEMFFRSGGWHLDVTASDALLIYLSFFGQDRLLETPSSIVLDRIQKIWKELVFQGSTLDGEEGPVVLVDEPKTAPKSIISSVLGRLPQTGQKPVIAAFIHEGTAEDSAWVRAHEEGRKEMAERLSGVVETISYEGCSNDVAVAEAIQDACAQGAGIVFTTSPTLMQATVKEAVMYPDVRFLNCSITLPHQSVRSYFGRMYEAKFILGALAASLSEDHRLLYHAHVPIFGTVSEIDAFALGAALTDPRSQVLLSWSRRGERTEFFEADLEKWHGAPLISGNDVTAPVGEPSAFGLYTLEDGHVHNLAVPVWHWGRYYELIMRSLLQGALPPALQEGEGRIELPKMTGDAQAMSYWYGLSSGVIDIVLSPTLPESSKRLVELLEHDIKAGTLRPFGGTILKQDGTSVTGEKLAPSDIVSLDWLAANVEGELPSDWKPAESSLPEVPKNTQEGA